MTPKNVLHPQICVDRLHTITGLYRLDLYACRRLTIMPRENPEGNLPFKAGDRRPSSWLGPTRIGGFRHIKSQNFGRLAYRLGRNVKWSPFIIIIYPDYYPSS